MPEQLEAGIKITYSLLSPCPRWLLFMIFHFQSLSILLQKKNKRSFFMEPKKKSLFILLIKKGLKKVEYKLLRESSPLWSDAIFKQTQWLSKCHSPDTEA